MRIDWSNSESVDARNSAVRAGHIGIVRTGDNGSAHSGTGCCLGIAYIGTGYGGTGYIGTSYIATA